MERFGTLPGPCYLTVYNGGETRQKAVLTLNAIEASGRMAGAYVVVTGDHGEAFWEHGSGTHGTDLSREQLEVGFAMRVPGMPPRRFDGVFSLLDVMPTVLHGLGQGHLDLFEGVPVQTRLPAGQEATAPLAPRAALTFQGWNERAYRFALTSADERMLFELDHRDPLRAKRLSVKGVTDLADVSLVDGDGKDAAGSYVRMNELIPAVNRRVAELTRNEDAMVCASARAGCVLAVAAVRGACRGRGVHLVRLMVGVQGGSVHSLTIPGGGIMVK